MSTVTPTTTFANTTDTTFRAWAQAVHDALASFGWVQTADTGQINLTTATKPATTLTYSGFEIWRANDSLQGTYPVFLKIEYGSGSNNASYPGLRITGATGTDGAGGLTGRVGAALYCHAGVSTVTTTGQKWSGGDERFVIVINVGGAPSPIFFCERITDTSGNPVGGGFCYGTVGATLDGFQLIQHDVASVPSSVASVLPVVVTGATNWAVGGDIYFTPVFPVGYGVFNPLRQILLYGSGDLTELVDITLSHYGTSHTWTPYGSRVTAHLSANANLRFLARFD